jgi:hypothetical protein
MVRMTVKEEEKKKPIGIINKEVDSIGHRSILNDELVSYVFSFIEPTEKNLDMISFFSFNYGIDEYVNIRNRSIFIYSK